MAYIRIGSATPRLSDHQERLKALWAKLQPYAWETGIAAQFLSSDEVLARLDYASYFDLTNQPLPDNRNGIFDKLAADRLVLPDVGGKWNITNLGAILFAKRLNDFSPSIARKGVRFVSYDGLNRAGTVTHRQDGKRGYASGFKGLIDYIDGLLPHNEHIGKAFREERPLYPSIAIRELIANALIHQDMTITGTSPLIEMFKDRLEITNPGQPLVRPERFLDSPPRSRNEALASPRLLKDLVAAMLFLVAFAAVVSLFMGKGALGALAGSGLVLAMLGFAIRNVVADTLSGVALGIEGPFRIGDWVDIDGLARGAVIEIGWRTTRLLTRDRTYVILPNSQIARQRITNYSAPKPEYRTQVSIALDHSMPIGRAREVMVEALKAAKLIQQEPPPDVRVLAYEEGGITYALRYWLSRFDRDIDCRDEVFTLVDEALRQAGNIAPYRRIEMIPTAVQTTESSP